MRVVVLNILLATEMVTNKRLMIEQKLRCDQRKCWGVKKKCHKQEGTSVLKQVRQTVKI